MSNFPFRSAGFAVDPRGGAYVNHEGLLPTYSVAVTGVTPAATATDVVILSGSATRIIKVRRVILGGAATSASAFVMNLVRRSTAATGGTATTPTPIRRDTTEQAATAEVQQFSANPSAVGTAVGTLQSVRVNLGALATPNPPFDRSFGDLTTEPILLRGASEFLAVDFAGASIPGGMVFDYTIIWTEE